MKYILSITFWIFNISYDYHLILDEFPIYIVCVYAIHTAMREKWHDYRNIEHII